jgi:hypothetical protein
MCGLGSVAEAPLIFKGIMKADLYTDILGTTLLPFLRQAYPDSHKFMQGSHQAKQWMEENDVNWWQTPAESPDMSPIENLWHELKEYIRQVSKPKTESELVQGISNFWVTVDGTKCRKYIGHLRKVLPRVIELDDAATGN